MGNAIEDLVSTKRYRDAITQAVERLSQDPNDPNLLYLAAVAHYFSEEYAEAAQVLERMVQVDPTNTDGLLLLALLCSWGYGGGYSKAPELYQEVLILNDRDVDAYIGLALSRDPPDVHMPIQRSIELLKRALEIDPARTEIHNNLGYAYWEAGQYDDATRHFKEQLKSSDASMRRAIRSDLRELKTRQRPRNIAYLGPALPRLP